MANALFRAYFSEVRDVTDAEELARLAAAVGIEEGLAREALSSPSFAAEVSESQDVAARLGISGVPFYILNGRVALSGAQPVDSFAEAIRISLQEH